MIIGATFLMDLKAVRYSIFQAFSASQCLAILDQ